MILQIRHLLDSNPAKFQVCRLSDGKVGLETDAVPNPVGFPVEGWPNKQLLPGLRWYLEEFLQYPFEPETFHAVYVTTALRKWGGLAFDALFDNRTVGAWLEDAKKKKYADLHLQIVSDEPAILAWPWEALYDKLAGCRLANACQIERRLNALTDPATAQALPKDRVNILLLIARPYDKDVRFRSIARPLVEWANRPEVPAQVHVLRPPTLSALRAHLREQKNFYHILHFDGHGAYGPVAAPVAIHPHQMQADVQGRLLFEKDDGSPDAVPAEKLMELLREGAVPAVVLNACQSAMVDERADDPFASVAAALLKAGMRSVTAMAYSLYVSAAQQFLPAFYQRLFEHGQLPDAVRAGRQQMVANDQRVCVRGTFPLEDWLVPVLYQQEAPDLQFVSEAKPKEAAATRLPEEAQDSIAKNPYGCVGRDGPILALERALRRDPAGILISGLGGVGKTTLVKGFLRWLEQTGGLDPARVFWFACNDIRTAEFVLNRLGERIFNANFLTLPIADKLKNLMDFLRSERCLIVWDNFESAKGMPGTAVTANLPDADCLLLRDLLAGLSGGATKVLITSRAPEDWLGHENRYLLKLAGLDGEERDDFANLIFARLGKKIDREDKDFAELMKLLNGHPLAMRVMLPKLEQHSAAALTKALRENFAALQSTMGDENEARLFATLRFATDALPEAWQPLLFLLRLHENYVNAGQMEAITKKIDATWDKDSTACFLGALASAGLLSETAPSFLEIHPALTGFLHSSWPMRLSTCIEEKCQRSFVETVSALAESLAPRPLHEQRQWDFSYSGNFIRARMLCQRIGLPLDYAAITQCLADVAEKRSDLDSSERLWQELAKLGETIRGREYTSVAFQHLGIIAYWRHDFDNAERWYHKSLEVIETARNEHVAASVYHHLGMICGDRHDFEQADRWYRKAIEISERLHDGKGAAITYHQLGVNAQRQKHFDAAQSWYCKAVEIKVRQGDPLGAAMTYHQLGMVARERRQFDHAEQWYRKSLQVTEHHRADQVSARTYHELAMVATEGRDFAKAQHWCLKSLELKERLGPGSGEAVTYNQLGIIAQTQGDFDVAERWYRKSLERSERLGENDVAASTYGQMGNMARERHDFDGAEHWYRKSLEISEHLGDERKTAATCGHLGHIFIQRHNLDSAEQWYRKSLEINERLGEEHAAGCTYHQLGRISESRCEFDIAIEWLRKAAAVFGKLRDGFRSSDIAKKLERLVRLRDGDSGSPGPL